MKGSIERVEAFSWSYILGLVVVIVTDSVGHRCAKVLRRFPTVMLYDTLFQCSVMTGVGAARAGRAQQPCLCGDNPALEDILHKMTT